MEERTLVGQYLTFSIYKQLFAIKVLRVREVLELLPITKVPKCPPFILGVFNLRGEVIPVMDLGIKLGLPPRPPTPDSSIIVTEWNFNQETVVVGTMVDSVHEVLEFTETEIQPPPRFGSQLQTDFLLGLANKGSNFIMLLNLDKVFSEADIIQMNLQVKES